MKLVVLGGGGARPVPQGPVRTSAMHRAQDVLGARFKDDAGWRVADVYTSIDDEIARAGSGVGLADASACGKLGVRGADVETLCVKLTGRAVPAVGHASRERVNGTAVLVCRRAADELLLLTPPSATAPVATVVEDAVEGGCAHVTDLTSAFAVVDLLGPRLEALLERLVPLDLSAVPALGLVQGELARVHAIFLRLDHPGRSVFRVLVPRECGEFVWRTLLETGHDLGLTPVGAAAHARMLGA